MATSMDKRKTEEMFCSKTEIKSNLRKTKTKTREKEIPSPLKLSNYCENEEEKKHNEKKKTDFQIGFSRFCVLIV